MGEVRPVSVRRKGEDRDNFTKIESSFIFGGIVCSDFWWKEFGGY